MTINLKFTGVIVWLGLGLLTHILFLGTAIEWSSALSLFVIFLWPFYLVWKFMILFFWIAIIMLVIGAVIFVYDRFFNKGF